MEPNRKKVVFSGIQPTGKLHIGNYIGALSLWVELQNTYDSIFCIVDYHAISIPEAVDPAYLRRKTRECAALYLACGIDPSVSSIFIQSHITAHVELAWMLNCVTPVGWLERMTQYKAKSAQMDTVGMGLLDYPVLQAADILLYDTDLVPVGEDQRQHIELTRDIAQRFGHLFGDAFVVPEMLIRSRGARVMGLDDPNIKMSKSLGEKKKGHAIGLADSADESHTAIMHAVTDPGRETRFDHASPGVLNLLTIYEVLSGAGRPELESRFEGKGYAVLKRELAELVNDRLDPIRKRYRELIEDPAHIEQVLIHGAERVRPIAERTLRRVKEKLGVG